MHILLAIVLIVQQQRGPLRDELTLLSLPMEADSSQVVARVGRPDSAAGGALHYRSYIVHMERGGRRSGLTLTRRGPATRRGLRVGDALQRIRRLYGDPAGRSDSEWRYDIEGDEHGPELIVRVRDGRVASIFIGYAS